MIGFNINNENLDIRPGTVLEIDRNNPFLQFDDIVGEYSLPFDVDLSPKNNRLLGYSGLLQSRVSPDGINAILLDNGLQHSIGKIKIEKPSINLNRSQNGSVSCYYLTGVSYFNQDSKNKRLRDIDMGGIRTFGNDNFNRAGNGFWGHIHAVLDAAPGTYDYVFYPVINPSFGASTTTDVINNVTYSGGTINFSRGTTDNRWANFISPFMFLKNVLQKAVEYCGWTLEGDFLNDPDFEKITMINMRCIDWGYKPLSIAGIFMRPTIQFNLVDFLPDIQINDFLLSIRKRLGLWYDFDQRNKTIRVQLLQDVALGEVKDYTKQASPLITKTIASEKKIYSIKVGSDDKAISFADITLDGAVTKFSDLPAAAEGKSNHAYLVIDENNYYYCITDDNNNWTWQLFTSNTRGVIPDNATDEIQTTTMIPEVSKYDAYLDFLPSWDEVGTFLGLTSDNNYSNGQIVLAFYFGIRNNKAAQPYPFASHHIYDSNDNQLSQWSLAFKANKIDGTEIGLYDLRWKKFIDRISVSETFQATLYLTRLEFMELSFSRIINIVGVNMYLTKLKQRVPFDGSVDIETVRA